MKTDVYKLKDEDRKWYLVDAEGKILGRVAVVIADLLRGKGKAKYSPNFDNGDNVVVINAEKVKLSREEKENKKVYYRHSGYPGGLKQETFKDLIEKNPQKLIFLAVKGMLPNNKLSKSQLKRLKLYSGSEHPHTQNLIKYEV